MDLYQFDETYFSSGRSLIVGVDEAGRGPWAGPVVAAAVILPRGARIPGLNDSKKLSAVKREKLYPEICSLAVSVGVGVSGRDLIDRINILEATYAAMKEALKKLSGLPDLVLVDGWPIPGLKTAQSAVIGGDAKSACIAAASVIAKVTRDRIMTEFAREYPGYSFEKHKGYGTREHREALLRLGPCALHRRSFAPVREALESCGGDQ